MVLSHPPYTKFIAWMRENGIQASEVADELGISKSMFSKRVNGTGADFSAEEVRRICVRYGISADAFFVDYKVS